MPEYSVQQEYLADKVYDVIIIGGGPAGLAAATYAARGKLSTVVVDKNPAAGALGKASRIEAFPGLLKAVSGMELLSILRQQAEGFGANVVRDEVVAVDLGSQIKEVVVSGGALHGRTIIIATGAMGREPSMNGEARLIGRGVAYCAACDAAFFQDAAVAMAGEAALALEELPQVAKFAKKIYLAFVNTALSQDQKEVVDNTPSTELLLGYRVVQILGDSSVTGLVLEDSSGGNRTLDVSGVFLYLHGRLPIVDFLQGAVKLSEGRCIKVDREDMSTSVEGVYAAGDVSCRRFYQAVVSAADGCMAALSAQHYPTHLLQ
ncbi:MAG: FAD-dependent oxidoreductase [Chloroflexi bacterium]|nr:FAD-dependent oxidoreductase [Chloroflexota bacterium]